MSDLGAHPTLDGSVTVRAGRYGPYVNHGKVNATLPKNVKPEELSLEQAVALLAEKVEKGGGGKTAAAKAGLRKSAAKRPASAAKAKSAGAKPAAAKPAAGKARAKSGAARPAGAKPAAARRAAPKRTAAE